MASFQVTFVCRICGKTEICAVWNPMTITEVCARVHPPQQFETTSSKKNARDG